MKITIITLFPRMISSFFEESIIKRAQEKGLVTIEFVNIRDFATDAYGTVDDKPYGGGTGMVIRPDVVYKALQMSNIEHQQSHVVMTSPKGKQFDQTKAVAFSKFEHLVILAGHYEAVDERINEYVDEEISLGDFVMTGGEITAAAIVDATVRLISGVLKKEDATQKESFFKVSVAELIKTIGKNETLNDLESKGVTEVQLLEYPHYTRPEEFEGKKVPEVLLSGNHAEIQKWRLRQAFEETIKKRPDLLNFSLP